MPAISLPFVIALLLSVLLLRLVLLREPTLRPAIGFVAACVIVAVGVGARWTLDWAFVRFLQPVLASGLPPVAWLCFTAGRTEASGKRWLHFLPVALVLLLSAAWRVWQSPIDLVLAVLYVGYGVALLRLVGAGQDGFERTRLSDTAGAQKATLAAGVILILSAIVDFFIAIDFGVYRGTHAEVIVTAGNLLLLPMLAYAVAVIGKSMPADSVEDSIAASPDVADIPTEEDSRIVTAIERLLQDKTLFRDPDLTLNRIAQRAGIPSRRISGAVNRLLGRNVSQLVNHYRVAEAKRLLAETDMPVTTVMLEAGFQTKSNFNREFLRATGVSPSDYRRTSTA